MLSKQVEDGVAKGNVGLVTAELIWAVTWDDINIDADRIVTAIKGVDIKVFKSNKIRSVCSALHITGIANARKDIMLNTLSKYASNATAYKEQKTSTVVSTTKAACKTLQYMIRLFNVLFSDLFAECFGSFGHKPS